MDDKTQHPDLSLLRSPSIPSSPAPPYSTLPYRDIDFYLAPMLHSKFGEIELETVDGKRFLVHKKLLEAETVFFHIYYGFVPVWRLDARQRATASAPATTALGNLLCLPKLFVNTITRSAAPPSAHPEVPNFEPSASSEPLAVPPSSPTCTDLSDGVAGPSPPPVPPKEPVTAPSPTTSPYIWSVPESSLVLESFLGLLYPQGSFVPSPEAACPSLDLLGRVIRAALGYQSSRAINLARDLLADHILTAPVEVYALASFFKFTDLARMASEHAVSICTSDWPSDARKLMGKTAAARLEDLQARRLEGLRMILAEPMDSADIAHSAVCVRRPMVQELWDKKRRQVELELCPGSELIELLDLDLRGGHCGHCLVDIGTNIQRCLYAARGLPRSI